MANIKIKFKSGTVLSFLHEGRAGGSYTKRVRYEGQMVIVIDEDGCETAFPVADVESVESTPQRTF